MKEKSKKWFDEDIPGQLAKTLLTNLGKDISDASIKIVKNKFEDYLAEYNMYHYSHNETGFCSLCGNGGVVDTTQTAISPKGIRTGSKNWCFCPNGVLHRKGEHEGELEEPNS